MSTEPMAPLAILIGTWNSRGEVLATAAGPATTMVATDTYRWLPGKHFIIHEVDARFGDSVARSLEVIGHDAATGRLVAHSYNDQGMVEQSRFSMDGKVLRIAGAAVRFEGSFNDDGTRLTGLWERLADRASWQAWIRLTLDRAC